MSRSIPEPVRRFVAARAQNRCEYCRVHQNDSFLPLQTEHVISRKHGGGNEPENLALACAQCNQHKGTDLTTFLTSYEDIVVLFNPRSDDWFEHFKVNQGIIIGITKIGQATIKVLKLNEPERVIHRQLLQEDGLWP